MSQLNDTVLPFGFGERFDFRPARLLTGFHTNNNVNAALNATIKNRDITGLNINEITALAQGIGRSNALAGDHPIGGHAPSHIHGHNHECLRIMRVRTI
jgi:hypothetical protein